MSRKLQQKQQRRLAEQMKKEQQRRAARRSNAITIAVAVLVLSGVVLLVLQSRQADEAPEAPEGVAASAAGCTEVEEQEVEGQQHVEVGTEVEYENTPPTSGDHWPPGAEAEPAFYSEAIDEESLVHNLEHGQIVIWYSPDAPQDTKDDLEAYVEASIPEPDEGLGPVIAAPYEELSEDHTYALGAWGASQACARYSRAAIDEFRRSFQGQGPEQVVPPFE